MNEIIDHTNYKDSDFFRGSSNLKRAGVRSKISPAMIREMKKCRDDIVYFCAKYVYITDVDKGVTKFKARKYQEKFWRKIQRNRFVISKQGRQSGKTAAIVGYLLHYSIFHKKRTVGIAAQNISQAREIIHRFKLGYENLPKWMQVGVLEWQKGGVELGNGTRLFASSSNGDALRGKSLSLLVLDEFAHIRGDKTFMEATWPVVSSGKKTKIIVISTPNGIGNAFHEIWSKAEEKLNNFVTFGVEWWEVPGRDKAWKKKQIAEIGLRKFNQEYASKFVGSSNTLVEGELIETIFNNCIAPIRTAEDEKLKYFKEPVNGGQYVMTVDVARGYGGDYSTFSVFRVDKKPYEQVATFADNMTSTTIFPYIIFSVAQKYNECFVVVERNESGGEIANHLYYEIEYPEMSCDTKGNTFVPGTWTSKTSKRKGTSDLRDLLECGKLKLNDEATVDELRTFEGDKKGSYNAKTGKYDDRIQNAWLFAYALTLPDMQYFKSDIEGVAELVHSKKIKDLLDNMPPIGIMNGQQMSDSEKKRMYQRITGEINTNYATLSIG